jgi:hypothetical protein
MIIREIEFTNGIHIEWNIGYGFPLCDSGGYCYLREVIAFASVIEMGESTH